MTKNPAQEGTSGREEVLDAAESCLQRFGLGKTTIEDVAKAAGSPAPPSTASSGAVTSCCSPLPPAKRSESPARRSSIFSASRMSARGSSRASSSAWTRSRKVRCSPSFWLPRSSAPRAAWC